MRATAELTRDALAIALSHIEHMAAWIAEQNAGYSFEALGEDMPGLRAALATSTSQESASYETALGGLFDHARCHNPPPWSVTAHRVNYTRANVHDSTGRPISSLLPHRLAEFIAFSINDRGERFL
ncbi:MAG: hypothetical protein AB7U62_19925 [Pseudolabrys sp.]